MNAAPTPTALPPPTLRLRFDPAAAALGILGLVLSAGVAGVILVRGNDFIPPEGDMMKALTFDGALGVYYLTLAFYLPIAGFSARARVIWLAAAAVLTLYGYGIETVQILRGIDPRFSETGSDLDGALGGLFGLAAVGQIVVFFVLLVPFLRPPVTPVRLAIRYAAVAVMLAFVAGLAMSVIGGRDVGDDGNLLLLHALGFHALQAIPLLGWLMEWSRRRTASAHRIVHVAGLAWLAMCAAIAAQTAMGRAPFELTVALIVAAVMAFVWAETSAFAVIAWRRGDDLASQSDGIVWHRADDPTTQSDGIARLP